MVTGLKSLEWMLSGVLRADFGEIIGVAAKQVIVRNSNHLDLVD